MLKRIHTGCTQGIGFIEALMNPSYGPLQTRHNTGSSEHVLRCHMIFSFFFLPLYIFFPHEFELTLFFQANLKFISAMRFILPYFTIFSLNTLSSVAWYITAKCKSRIRKSKNGGKWKACGRLANNLHV